MRCVDASNKAIYSRSLNPKREVIKKHILLPSIDYACVKAKASYYRCTRCTNSNKVCVPVSISNPLLATPLLIRFSSRLTSAPKLLPMLRRLRVTPATTTSCSTMLVSSLIKTFALLATIRRSTSQRICIAITLLCRIAVANVR